MRSTIVLFAVTALFAACKGDKKEGIDTQVQTLTPDSTYNNSLLTDTGKSINTAAPATEKTDRPVTKPTPKGNTTAPAASTPAPQPPAPTPVYEDNTPAPTASTGTETTPAPAPAETKKKGMSNAGQGAIIGGVAGAIGGAVISKKKGKGAIIGGVIGAAGGAIIGKQKDKKAAAADTTN